MLWRRFLKKRTIWRERDRRWHTKTFDFVNQVLTPGGSWRYTVSERGRARSVVPHVGGMVMPEFKVVSEYTPSGDQPQAIEKLARGIEDGLREQVLLGVTGSGKTYTMAKVIEAVQRPTLVLAHNKTLAAQLCEEFKEFFPNNAVEYFVSYYDYYQPEAYIPHTDTYIEKDASTNEEIDRLRLSATCALLERRDVIVVSSVSCIYGLGEPEDFAKMMISLRPGMTLERDELLRRLVEIRYERNDVAFDRNMFRVRGDTVEIYPAYWKDAAIRVEFFGDEIDRISQINPVTGAVTKIAQPRAHLARQPLRHLQGQDGPGPGGDREGAGRAGGLVRGARQAGGGPAHPPADHLRHGDDAGAGLLLRHRELLPGDLQPARGLPAPDPDGLLPRRLRPLRGREPRDAAPGPGHVQRGPGPEGEPGRIRLPPALRLRQPAPEVRRVRGAASTRRSTSPPPPPSTSGARRTRSWSR